MNCNAYRNLLFYLLFWYQTKIYEFLKAKLKEICSAHIFFQHSGFVSNLVQVGFLLDKNLGAKDDRQLFLKQQAIVFIVLFIVFLKIFGGKNRLGGRPPGPLWQKAREGLVEASRFVTVLSLNCNRVPFFAI